MHFGIVQLIDFHSNKLAECRFFCVCLVGVGQWLCLGLGCLLLHFRAQFLTEFSRKQRRDITTGIRGITVIASLISGGDILGSLHRDCFPFAICAFLTDMIDCQDISRGNTCAAVSGCGFSQEFSGRIFKRLRGLSFIFGRIIEF